MCVVLEVEPQSFAHLGKGSTIELHPHALMNTLPKLSDWSWGGNGCREREMWLCLRKEKRGPKGIFLCAAWESRGESARHGCSTVSESLMSILVTVAEMVD